MNLLIYKYTESQKLYFTSIYFDFILVHPQKSESTWLQSQPGERAKPYLIIYPKSGTLAPNSEDLTCQTS